MEDEGWKYWWIEIGLGIGFKFGMASTLQFAGSVLDGMVPIGRD